MSRPIFSDNSTDCTSEMFDGVPCFFILWKTATVTEVFLVNIAVIQDFLSIISSCNFTEY
jgi:hypothetical protein